MTKQKRIILASNIAVALGVFTAGLEGMVLLGCASRPALLIALTGAFTAGAGLATAVAQLRIAKLIPAAEGDGVA